MRTTIKKIYCNDDENILFVKKIKLNHNVPWSTCQVSSSGQDPHQSKVEQVAESEEWNGEIGIFSTALYCIDCDQT